MEELKKYDFSTCRRAVRLFAVRAYYPDKPLCQHPYQRGSDEERLDPHVGKPHYSRGGVICMESTEHEMAGQRSLDRDLGCIHIPYLSDHYNVRVLPQYRPQA